MPTGGRNSEWRSSLYQPAEILLLDEPFGALDAQTRSSMQAYLFNIWRNVDVTVLRPTTWTKPFIYPIAFWFYEQIPEK